MNNYKFIKDTNIGKYTTMKLRAMGDIYEVYDVDSLVCLIKNLKEKNTSYIIVGWGANQVFKTKPKKTLIKLKFDEDKTVFMKPRDEYELSASTALTKMQSHARKYGLKGWEVFTGIPGSLGGAIAMNAGTAMGEIGSLIKEVTILRENLEIDSLKICKDHFSYRSNNFLNRNDIIIGAKVIHFGVDKSIGNKISEYMEYRKNSQPLKTFNCGCVFKNKDEVKAGLTIDQLGLKGFNYKGLYISSVHANFIENRDEIATGEDLVEFIEQINERTLKQSAIKFELEVKIV